jgi:hypothetical protein
MGRVEELGAQPAELQGDGHVLAQPVASRGFDDRDEVVREVAQGRLVRWVAEEEVRGRGREAG